MGKFPHKEKLERREGEHLHLKGERCSSPKCGVSRRNFPPGVHGQTSKRRLTPFGVQLREKQKVKKFYGILERQFRKYFDKATVKTGDTSKFLMLELEKRLDNVVFRLGFAKSRRHARQIVNHGHFLVNGKLVDIPSYSVKIGDKISIKDSKQKSLMYSNLADRLKKQELPSWLVMDLEKLEGKVTGLPNDEELKQIFEPQLIVEFYSR